MLTVALCGLVLGFPSAAQDSYVAGVEKWRGAQEAALKAEGGWLSVSGLYWLKEGVSTMGAGPSCDIVLPQSSTSGTVGRVTFGSGKVVFSPASGVTAKVNGQPTSSESIDLSQARVSVGSLTFVAIQRGKRTGIRLWDTNSKARREFKGQHWFPVDEKYRIEAKFISYPTPKTMPITNVLGDTSMVANPGYVVFSIEGKECRLEAEAAGEGLFFNFRDGTSGRETYPAGRFLDAPGPQNGTVLLDFNKATNPPCAFTDYATCPLPPLANYLKVRIPAGEKTHHPVK